MTDDKIQGELVVAIGDTIAEVAARSSYPLNTAILTDEDLSAADKPVRLRYSGPNGLSFQTRTVAINSVATIVTGVESAPQLEFVGRKGVPELLGAIEQRLRAARWEPVPGAHVTSQKELREQLGETSGPEVTAWHVGIYTAGSTVVTLRLRRLHKASDIFPDGAYLLNLVWRNDEVRKKAEMVADALRKEDHVSPTTPRPVNAQSYGGRVRLLMPG